MNVPIMILSTIFWIAGSGLYFSSLTTTFWIYSFKGLFHYGLFERCGPSECVKWSSKQTETPSHIFVAEISMLLASIFLILGVFLGLMGWGKNNMKHVIGAGAFYIFSGITIWSACMLFSILPSFQRSKLYIEGTPVFHYSYYFGWVSGLMYLIAGLLAVMAVKSQNHSKLF